jgi:glycosyltransferase involved in cell wall biosynthesis
MPKVIKIAIDARFMLRPLRGIPLYVYRICQYLPAIAPEAHFYYLINTGYEHNDSAAGYRPRMEWIKDRYPNVEFVDQLSDAEIVWEQFYLPRLLKKLQVDLLHMPANRVCFSAGVPTVVTLHDVMEYEYLRPRFTAKVVRSGESIKARLYHARAFGYALLNYKMMNSKADRVITVSNASLREIHQKLAVPVERIRAIYHGLDDEFADLAPVSLAQRRSVLAFGGDSAQKNPEALIYAWSMLPTALRAQYRLKIIGFCGTEASPLWQAVKECALETEVDIHGWVSSAEVVKSYLEARAFLYLSRNEGFGFPLIHAMAAGTPIVSSNRGSIPEVLGDLGLQYHPDDHSGIAAGIEALLTDEVLWRNQSKAGLQRSRQFSWQKAAAGHWELFKTVMNQTVNP